jgi:hypothetical protein
MNALDSRIKELVAYARERDGEDRTALFRNLVDLFLTNKAPTKQPTRGQLLEVVTALIPHVEPESRRTVADLLASLNNPPMDLIHCIVKDRATLVSKLLKTAPFEEDDLIELIETTGREHHQELASRSDLSANVWIALARATPSAPPYGSNSTLALWREDLGLDKSEKGPDLSTVGQNDLASVTPLHPEKHRKPNARIRILRTDEDILTSHIDGQNNPNSINFVQEEASDTEAENIFADHKEPARNNAFELESRPVQNPENRKTSDPKTGSVTSEKPTFRNLKTPEPIQEPQNPVQAIEPPEPSKEASEEVIQRPLIEPESGSWAWRSDRDGFIIQVSSEAEKLLGNKNTLVGSAMLDMLALNTKLGHPVSRAFQRRTSIHEAPIYLADLEQAQRYWTLEASPLFNPRNGAFDGYEGILKPVIPARGEDDIIPADDPSPDVVDHNRTRLVQEEPQMVPVQQPVKIEQPRENKTPLSWFDQPGLGGREGAIPQTDEARLQKHSHPSTKQAADDLEQKEIIPAEVSFQKLEDMIAENLGKQLQSKNNSMSDQTVSTDIADTDTEVETTPTVTEDAMAVETTAGTNQTTSDTHAESYETIESTLELMEQALERLAQAEAKNNTLQIRLQSEIAQACARTLKSELALLK